MSHATDTSIVNSHSHGTLLPFMLDNVAVRGKLVRIENLNNHIKALVLGDHGVAKMLSELLVAAAVLAFDLKENANVTLQIHSESDLPLLVAKCNKNGVIKGFVEKPHVGVIPEETIAKSGEADSVFVVTIDFGPGSEPYQSMVPIRTTSISESIEGFFTDSAQLKTYFRVFTGSDKQGRTSCGALFLQAMPAQGGKEAKKVSDDDWRRMALLLSTLQPNEILPGKISENDVLNRLFAEDTVRIFPEQNLTFTQASDRERMAQALLKIGIDECRDLLTEQGGEIVVEDEYSGAREVFVEADLATLFGDDWVA